MVDQPEDLLQAVAQALAGEDGCCCLWNTDGRCCLTDGARRVFDVIGERTGLSYEWLLGAERIMEDRRRKKATLAAMKEVIADEN